MPLEDPADHDLEFHTPPCVYGSSRDPGGVGPAACPDKGHAVSADRLARKNREDGNLTKAEYDRINRKASKVLKD